VRWFDTTAGRALLGQVLPKSAKVPFDTVNKLMTKREISNMIDLVYRHCGQKETVIFCDRIMALEMEDRRRDAHARQGIRAAVQRRPHYPGREIQQGGRRLVEGHREDRR